MLSAFMASLKLINGIWHIRYRDKRGKSRSTSTKLHTSPKNDVLAQKKLVAFEMDLMRGQYPVQSMKIDALLDDALNDYRANQKRSLAKLKIRIEKNLRPWFGEMRADRLAADDWRAYVTHRQGEGATNGTINLERANLLYGYSLAVRAGRLDTRPFLPRLNVNKKAIVFVDRRELEILCRHLPEYLSRAAKFAFLTGWRLGEIRQLQWRHIDFEAGEIRLDPGMTKNGDGRVFPMTKELRSLLDGLKPTGAVAVLGHADDAEKVVLPGVPALTPFVFHFKGRPIGWIYDSWDKAVNAIGKPGMLFRNLRNSAIIDMDQRGIPRRVIMDLVGHKNPEMFTHYRRVGKTDLEMARELMDGGNSVGISDARKVNPLSRTRKK